jgi:hypothetical protein
VGVRAEILPVAAAGLNRPTFPVRNRVPATMICRSDQILHRAA